MGYLSDRQRVELMIPIMAGFDIVINGSAEQDDDYRQALAYLKAARDEIVGTNRLRIMRRAERAYRAAMADHLGEDREVAKAGLITFHWLSQVLASGYLVLPDDSPLSKAFDVILPALQPLAEIEAVDHSARKQARHVLKRFQDDELYCGIEIKEAA